MDYLSTHIVHPVTFNRNDFDEAMAMLQRISGDSEAMHPEYDDELRRWIAHWYTVLASLHEDTSATRHQEYYIALPVDDALIFSSPDTEKSTTMMPWRHNHPLLLVAVAIVINLSQCERFAEVAAILHYLRGNHWLRKPVDMHRRTAMVVRDNFYRTLGQLINTYREQQDEN